MFERFRAASDLDELGDIQLVMLKTGVCDEVRYNKCLQFHRPRYGMYGNYRDGYLYRTIPGGCHGMV